jgi:hypothetical protein
MINLFQTLYLNLSAHSGSYTVALIILSVFTAIMLTLLNRIFRIFPQREAQVQGIMAAQLAEIRQNYRGAQAQQKISDLYRRYRYHPVFALRSALPLIFQLPFLFAAYHALKDLPELSGVGFWIIRDLAQPDAMILGYNVLPFLMTGINLLTAGLNPEFRLKDKLQASGIAILFLALLYNAPAALLIYWTSNNLIFLLKVLALRMLDKGRSPVRDAASIKLQRALPAFSIRVLLPFLILIVFSNFLEFIADAEGIFFYRFSKTVPLFMASIGLYYLVLAWGAFPYKRVSRILGFVPLLMVGLAHLSGHYRISDKRFVIFAYLAGYYLALSAVLVIYQMVPRKHHRKPGAASAPLPGSLGTWLIYAACLLIPSLHLAAANPDYLSAWYYPLFLVLPYAIFILGRMILKLTEYFVPGDERDQGLLSLYALAFAMLFCFLPVLRAMMQKNSAHDGDFWLILLVAMLLIWLYRRFHALNVQALAEAAKPIGGSASAATIVPPRAVAPKHTKTALNSIFIVLFLAALGNFTLSLIRGESSSRRDLQLIPALLQNLEIMDKPNIYLFVYDGVPNPRVFREQNLPFAPLQELFAKYGYKIYEDTYTLGNESLNSMAMLLNMSAEQYSSMSAMQDVYSGNSVTNLLLTQAGYHSHKLLKNYYTGTHAISNQDLVTEYFPPKELSAVQSDFFFTLLRGVLQGEFRFDTKGIMAEDRYSEDDRQKRKHELIKDGVAPKFVLDHFSQPGHSQNSGKCLPNETELWIERYLAALQYLEQDLAALHEHDPTAIAVFIGDHGPALSGDCYVLQNWKLEDITPDLIWDRIGTLVAIRWPDHIRAEKYDQELSLNQDIFPVILSYLADDPAPLELMPDRTFSGYGLLTRPALRFREGEVLGINY